MPFGLTSASEEYQRRMNDALGDIQGIKIFIDDILVFGQGETLEKAILDHDAKIIKLFDRLKKLNIKLNPDKI